MNGFYPVIEYISNGINRARDTKQSIIAAVNSYEHIQKRRNEIEQEKLNKAQNQKQEKIYFDPAEVEPIVFRDYMER